MPGNECCTTSHPAACNPAESAGIPLNMPESPTIIAVPVDGIAIRGPTGRATVVGGGVGATGGTVVIVVGAVVSIAVVVVVVVGAVVVVVGAAVTTVGTRSRSVRTLANCTFDSAGSANRATPATAMPAAPANASDGRASVRTGRSTRYHDNSEPPTVTESCSTTSGAPSKPVRSGVSNTIAGQCHRYSAYEIRPIPRRSGRSSAKVTPPGTVAASTRTRRRSRRR